MNKIPTLLFLALSLVSISCNRSSPQPGELVIPRNQHYRMQRIDEWPTNILSIANEFRAKSEEARMDLAAEIEIFFSNPSFRSNNRSLEKLSQDNIVDLFGQPDHKSKNTLLYTTALGKYDIYAVVFRFHRGYLVSVTQGGGSLANPTPDDKMRLPASWIQEDQTKQKMTEHPPEACSARRRAGLGKRSLYRRKEATQCSIHHYTDFLRR